MALETYSAAKFCGSPYALHCTRATVTVTVLQTALSQVGRVEVQCEIPAVSSGGSKGITHRERLQFLWQDFFLAPTLWWDNRHDKMSPSHPDFRHKSTKEALWVDSRYKPAWVDSQLASWDAQQVEATERKTWIIKLCEDGDLIRAVEALGLLLQQGPYVDQSLIYGILKNCIVQKDLVLGRRIHALALECGFESDPFLANHLIRMYASHGRLQEAMEVFTKVAAKDTYMWASIILASAEHGKSKQALTLYQQMRQSIVKPNSHVYVAVLKACASAAALALGKEVHADILRSSLEHDVFVGSCLVDMYVKCGSLEHARRLFDRLPSKNVVTWTAMIAGYALHGLGEEALTLFTCMEQEGMSPADRVTFLCLLKACGSSGALLEGKAIHSQIHKKGLEADVVVGNCLVDMYVKCGSLEDARIVFDRLPRRDVVTWTAMIAGYAQHGLGQKALSLYACMEREGIITADRFMFAYLLQTCSIVGALQQGKKLHSQILERGLEADVVIRSCLVEMYAKCGSLEEARKVLDRLPTTDVVIWTALLNGYAEHSYAQMAVRCFEEMQQQGVEPNEVTFICLLVACSHEGLVKEGQRFFEMMVEDYNIVPNVHHYNCLVDLFGRSGCLDEAENVLQTMPFESDVVGWTSLLSACKSHGDIERGKQCFERLVTLEPETATAYVLLGSIYANAGRWKDVDVIESLRKYAGARKKPARACIEVHSQLHEFTVGEDSTEISSKLGSMISRVKKEGGHVPHTDIVLTAVSAREKEDALCGHAEKLALAFGLMNTTDGTPLLVTKNLRMCNDCHSGTKILSRLEKREIIVRDAHRVHRFLEGSCSCGDRH